VSVSARIDLDGLVNGVVDRLAGRLNKPDIFILASPGCSRGRLVTVLLRRGLVDVVYAYGGFGSKVGDDVRGRVIEFGSIDELAGKLGNANGRVAVVARSTTDAIRLRDKLGNAEVIYLPKYYKDAAKEVLSGGAPEVAKVRHEGLGEGISPSMLREDLPSKDVESIRELSLGKVSFGDLIKDFLKKAPRDVAAPAITLGLSFLLGVGVAVSLVSSLAGRFLEMVVDRWRKNRDEVIGGFVRLLGAARKVKNYLCDERLCDERYEAVFDEVAYEWGLGIEEFANTITNIANITEGKQLTEEDIKKIINDKLEGIEEALKKIEEELREVRESVRGRLAGVEVFFINDFEYGLAYPTVRLVDRELMVLGEYGYHEVVRTGSFGALASEVGRRLGAGSLVVLTGPKGVGKSTLAAVTIWELLRSGEAGMVLRIKEPPDGEVVESFRSFIESFLVRDWEYFGNLIILYDPTGVYGQVGGVEAPSKLETTVRNILEAVRRAIENAKSILGREPSARVGVLIIVPTDLYNALSNDVRGKLESYRLDASLNDAEFLAELIREYTKSRDKPNGCELSSDVFSKLADEVAKFDSGHALIARLIGEELVRNNCNVGEVEELIDNAKGKAEVFITQYINKLFKVDKDPNVAEALVEIFALRKPFINLVRPGDPILTQGIIKLISEKREAKLLYSAVGEELRGWLAIRQHDLIEEAIGKLLDCVGDEGEGCEVLGDAPKTWKTIVMESLREVSEKVRNEDGAVEYFASNYGEKLTNTLKLFSNECWKRAAYIIGHALAGIPTVPRPEDLPESLRGNVAESLGNALKRCGVDDYLLVGNVIPPLIMGLAYTLAFALALIDKYNEAVAEVNRILNIARGRGINVAESLYGLGLASIIANAARLGRDVKPSDADTALHIVAFTIQRVASPDLIKSVLGALEPLRDKTPHRYLELLAPASGMENLDLITVRYIFDKLNEILDNYGDVVRGYAWSLVLAIVAYAVLLWVHRRYFDNDEVKGAVGRVVYLLNELGRFKTSLGVIAWALALTPALRHEDVRGLMEEKLGIDVVGKASEVLEELNDKKKRVQELMRDEEFMSYIESKFVKADEEAVKQGILEAASLLKQVLAIYRLDSNELDEAEELFKDAAEERREIGDYEDDLVLRGWVLRVEAIKGSLVGDGLTKLVDGFRQLYEEAFNEERFKLTARYLSIASGTLGEYLVSLALMGDHETINKLPEEHLWVLNANKQVSVLTRLMLNALLSPRGRLSSELEGKLSVNPEELIDAFGYDMLRNSLPALRVALGIAKPEVGIKLCEEFNDEVCIDLVLAVKGNSVVVKQLREAVINASNNSLKGFGFDANALTKLINEFRGLVSGLDNRSLVQLIAPSNSMALLALMLHALINGNKEGNKELAKALALKIAIYSSSKLLGRLFLEAYRECCNLESEGFRLAIARLFFLHV